MLRLLLLLLACGALVHARRLPLATSSQIHSLQDACEVSEVHLSLGEHSSSMHLAWRTVGTNCGSYVSYGPVEDMAPPGVSSRGGTRLKEVEGATYSLTESNMCAAPAKKKKFVVNMHVAQLTDLQPDTAYWYRIQGSSRAFGFHSPPRVGADQPRRFSFLAFGDMGENKVKGRKSPMAARTVLTMRQEMSESAVDLVLHIGDLAYADGSYKVWDSFMDQIEPVASKVPYMVGIGNHEYDFQGPTDNDPSGVRRPYHPEWGNFGTESGGECGAMTARRFVMPNRDSNKDNAPFWYSFDYGSMHVTMISTEHDISPGSLQYNWLARDLAAVDRCVTPWLVVALHRPMYVVYPHKDNRVVGDHLRDFIEDLLLEYKVDLTIAGHVHTYYRTCDVRQERCMDDGSGITHFVIGTAGKALSDITDEQRSWLAGDVNDWGFVRFDVDRDVMQARFILSSSGHVRDEVKVVTHLYTPEECDDLRSQQPQRLAALEEQLTLLQAQYEQQSQASSTMTAAFQSRSTATAGSRICSKELSCV